MSAAAVHVPAQDLEAEASVLGAAMVAESILPAIVAETRLRPDSFYRERHRLIFRAMLSLADRGASIDAITVSDELRARGTLTEAGGKEAVSELASTVNVPGNALHYARIVAEQALWRSRIAASQKLQEACRAQDAEKFADAEGLLVEDPVHDTLIDVDEQRDLLVEIAEGGAKAEFMWPYHRLNVATEGGMRRGELNVLSGATNEGKALGLDTPLPTPRGWTTIGDVQVGEQVFDETGHPTTVTAVSPIYRDRPCFELEFADGSIIVADESHRWRTSNFADRRNGRAPRIRTTREIARTLTGYDGRSEHAIEVAGELQYPGPAELPIEPYTLGAWLADGSRGTGHITTGTPEVVEEIRAAGYDPRPLSRKFLYTIHGLMADLRELGVLQDKHIPRSYLAAPASARLALLQGFMDSDGAISATGQCELSQVNRRLADDALELILGLGMKATLRSDPATLEGRRVGTRHRIKFRTTKPIFRLERKRARLPVALKSERWFIRAATPLKPAPVRCIEVDSPSRLFLAGRSLIATHNSHLADEMLDLNRKRGARVCLYDLESQIRKRLARRAARQHGVPIGPYMRGELDEAGRKDLVEHINKGTLWPIVPAHGWTATEVSHDIRRNRWDFVVIDLLHMFPFKEERELSAIVAQLKATAGMADCCILLVAHVNRGLVGPDGRRRRPVRSDLRWSGDIENMADVVCFVWRDQNSDNEQLERGFVYHDKIRDGDLAGASQAVRFNPRRLRFETRQLDVDERREPAQAAFA